MSTTTVNRSIQAPVESVFQTVADIQNFSKAVPDIVGVEFLSDVKSGLGARFKETRLMVMEAKPYRFLAKLVTPLMKGMLFKALAKDMDAVKAYCEG